MTSKDYIAIAAALKDNRKVVGEASIGDVWYKADVISMLDKTIEDVALVLAADNPRFDRKKFLSACGVK